MPRLKNPVLCTFKPSVKKQMRKDGNLLIKLSNILGSTLGGVEAMINRDSQTLFHCSALEAISEALGIEQSELKTCKR